MAREPAVLQPHAGAATVWDFPLKLEADDVFMISGSTAYHTSIWAGGCLESTVYEQYCTVPVWVGTSGRLGPAAGLMHLGVHSSTVPVVSGGR